MVESDRSIAGRVAMLREIGELGFYEGWYGEYCSYEFIFIPVQMRLRRVRSGEQQEYVDRYAWL
jgi:hypothetical protein